jgi:polar amino acid transport system substrate-binding protein
VRGGGSAVCDARSENRRHSGFFADICRDFGQNVLKVKVQFVDTTRDNTWPACRPASGICPWRSTIPRNGRAVSFSSGASSYEVSFAYNKSNPKLARVPQSIAEVDKPGVTVAVMSGTSQDKVITAAFKQAQIMRLPGMDETRLAVTSRRADLLADASDSNWIFVESHPEWAAAFAPKPALAKQEVALVCARPPRLPISPCWMLT